MKKRSVMYTISMVLVAAFALNIGYSVYSQQQEMSWWERTQSNVKDWSKKAKEGIQGLPEKSKQFWNNNKKKIQAGVAAAAAIGIAIIAAIHVDKTQKAIQDAGIKSGDEDYSQAVTVIGLCGPVGPDLYFITVNSLINQGRMTFQELRLFLDSRVAKALAYYWDISETRMRQIAGEHTGFHYGVLPRSLNASEKKIVDMFVDALQKYFAAALKQQGSRF